MKEKYYPPVFGGDAFHCPHCGVYARQEWFELDAARNEAIHRHREPLENFSASKCHHCNKFSIWFGDKMLYPTDSQAPLPEENMPEEVKEDFLEARNIVNASPRAAAALLRLALQKLMVHLGEKGENLNEDIANLVKKGLPETIQKALDSVRVIGNNAVHPGQIDLKDDTATAIILFELLNLTVEVMITQPKKVNQIYDKIPHEAKEAIKRRNGK